LLRQLTCAQFAEWVVYFNIEPDADLRVDSLLAQQLAMTGNINRSEHKTEPFEPTDFMPWADKPAKPKEKAKIEPIDPKAQSSRLKALFSKKGKI